MSIEFDDWLKALASNGGVFVVRLIGEDKNGSLIDHCLSIDTDCRLVMNSFEKHCMCLETGVLETFLGDEVIFQRVDEARCFHVQNNAKKKRERKKNPK